MLARVLFALGLLSVAGCGALPRDKDRHEAPDDASSGADGGAADGGTADRGSESSSLAYDLSLLVREPGQTEVDAAAMFIVKTASGSPVIKGVVGPKFLGNAAVGLLTADTLQHLFVNLTSPLAPDAKAKLLEKYAGASIVYFEAYKGRLCDGGQYRLELTTEYEGEAPLASFDFLGSRPDKEGNCFFNSLSLMTSTHSTR